MKSKELYKKLEEETINNEHSTSYVRDIMFLFIKKLFSNLVILTIVLIFSILLINKVSVLSFVNPKYYVISLVVFVILQTALYLIMFALYIYKERKKRFKEHFSLKKLLKAYKYYDLISYIINVVACVYFIVMFIATPAQVVGSSMDDTYHNGDRVLVWHLVYDPKVDDVVIIEINDKLKINDNSEMIIKRIVAKENDEVRFEPAKDFLEYLNSETPGKLYINDKLVEENLRYGEYQRLLTYRYEGKSYQTGLTSVVPKGYYLVLGDNRAVSLDSRIFGLVPKENILGKSFLRIYPVNHFGIPKYKPHKRLLIDGEVK